MTGTATAIAGGGSFLPSDDISLRGDFNLLITNMNRVPNLQLCIVKFGVSCRTFRFCHLSKLPLPSILGSCSVVTDSSAFSPLLPICVNPSADSPEHHRQ